MTQILNMRDIDKIITVIEEYEKLLDDVEEHLKITGKTLEKANLDNPAWLVFYDQKRIELKKLVELADANVKRVRGKLFKRYTETYARELSDRAKDKYIDNEEAFLTAYELYLEIKELYDKFQSVVDGFINRGYALNNITKARVAEVNNHLL